MKTIVNNLSKEGVVSSIESVSDCVGNVCIKTKFVSFAEKRVETVAVSSWAVTRPGWAGDAAVMLLTRAIDYLTYLSVTLSPTTVALMVKEWTQKSCVLAFADSDVVGYWTVLKI